MATTRIGRCGCCVEQHRLVLALRSLLFCTRATVVSPSRRPTLFRTVFSLLIWVFRRVYACACYAAYPRSCCTLFALYPISYCTPFHDVPSSCRALFRLVPFFVLYFMPYPLPCRPSSCCTCFLPLRLHRPFSCGWIFCFMPRSCFELGRLFAQILLSISLSPGFVRSLSRPPGLAEYSCRPAPPVFLPIPCLAVSVSPSYRCKR